MSQIRKSSKHSTKVDHFALVINVYLLINVYLHVDFEKLQHGISNWQIADIAIHN